MNTEIVWELRYLYSSQLRDYLVPPVGLISNITQYWSVYGYIFTLLNIYNNICMIHHQTQQIKALKTKLKDTGH